MQSRPTLSGTTRGLGKALAEQFQRQLWRVVPLDRPDFDLAEFNAIRFRQLLEGLDGGGRRVFVSNAATLHIAPADQLVDGDVQREVATNITGPIEAMSVFLSTFKDGEIAIVTSTAAAQPLAHWGLYCAGKAAMEAFVGSLEKEGRKCHVLNPGAVDTDMQAKIARTEFPGREQFTEMRAKGAIRDATAVAKVLVWKVDRA